MTDMEKLRDKRLDTIEEVQAKTVGRLVSNMTKREQKEAVKSCGTDVLFDELTRRCELMQRQINEARKVLKVR